MIDRERAGGGAWRSSRSTARPSPTSLSAHHDQRTWARRSSCSSAAATAIRRQVGSIDGVSFDDIHGSSMRYAWGSVITGTIVGTQTFGISNIAFSNIELVYKGAGATRQSRAIHRRQLPRVSGAGAGPDRDALQPISRRQVHRRHRRQREHRATARPAIAFFVRHASNVSFASCKRPYRGADSRPCSGVKDVSGLSGAPCSP